MPFSRNIRSATSLPVNPVDKGILLYFVNLDFSTAETKKLIPKNKKDTNMISLDIFA
jgi:hypothetical protein